MNYISLNDGVRIPQIGFGTFQIPADGSAYQAVKAALAAGYRHIDTAAAYFNEEEVGRAIKESGIVREEIFLTTKLWLQDYGYEQGKKGIERCLRHLGTYIDLMLIHQPYGDVAGAWKAMEEYKKSEDIRSLGVSNMTPAIWQKIVPGLSSTTSVNQVEFNPYCQQKELRALMSKEHVMLEAWAPL
ncbi:MAG: aldo/keto reductase, partial [Selenomonadaceae bacterium]|nr:aldo/keto reductase [Selenomonadaceae bacterium]